MLCDRWVHRALENQPQAPQWDGHFGAERWSDGAVFSAVLLGVGMLEKQAYKDILALQDPAERLQRIFDAAHEWGVACALPYSYSYPALAPRPAASRTCTGGFP